MRRTRSPAQADARLHVLARGKLDDQGRDQLIIELAKNPALVSRLAEHLHALSPLAKPES
jgi:hypothetical protein